MIQTPRLILRQWQETDLEPWAEMNADPAVREFFTTLLTREKSDQWVRRHAAAIEEKGWGFWAAELRETSQFIGFVGLFKLETGFPFCPAVEVGWRLAREYWGKGYATEGGRASLAFGFEELQLEEIIAITPVGNQRSRRVMAKLGMHHDENDDFDEPTIPLHHPLRRHVLYRLEREEWQGQSQC